MPECVLQKKVSYDEKRSVVQVSDSDGLLVGEPPAAVRNGVSPDRESDFGGSSATSVIASPAVEGSVRPGSVRDDGFSVDVSKVVS